MTPPISRRAAIKGLTLAAGTAGLAPALLTRAGATTKPALGEVHSFSRAGVMVHSYVSPADALNVTSHVIDLGPGLLVIDATFLPETGAEVAAVIASTGKPVLKAILSHEHPDHWSGAPGVTGVTFDTLPDIRADVAAEAGSAIPANVASGADLAMGATTIGGVPVEFRRVQGTEAKNMIVTVLPDQKIAVVQDLVYNGVYFAPGYDRQKWIATLEGFRGDPAFETLLVGHGLPTTRGELDMAIGYLKVMAEAIDGDGATPEKAQATLKAAFPGHSGDFLLGLIPEYWPK
jgi:glyoxylase-like metal-dependent hydrolase (beta-lactamase superfamily II)